MRSFMGGTATRFLFAIAFLWCLSIHSRRVSPIVLKNAKTIPFSVLSQDSNSDKAQNHNRRFLNEPPLQSCEVLRYSFHQIAATYRRDQYQGEVPLIEVVRVFESYAVFHLSIERYIFCEEGDAVPFTTRPIELVPCVAHCREGWNR